MRGKFPSGSRALRDDFREYLEDLRFSCLLADAEAGQDLVTGRLFLLEQREQDVFGTHEVVPQPQRFAERELLRLPGLRVVRDELRDRRRGRAEGRNDRLPDFVE